MYRPLTIRLQAYLSNIRLALWHTNNKCNHIALGRWSICYDENQLQSRIRLANEDHCGTCSGEGHPINKSESKEKRLDKGKSKKQIKKPRDVINHKNASWL